MTTQPALVSADDPMMDDVPKPVSDSRAQAFMANGAEITPIRRYAETYSLLRLVQPLSGVHVLDAACGDGYFSRLVLAAGAKRVHGIDHSAAMVDTARQKTPHSQISYDVANVLDLGQAYTQYDLVLSPFAHSRATNTAELQTMCQQLYGQLKPGGRLLALNDHPNLRTDHASGFKKYGLSKTMASVRFDGSIINAMWHCTDQNRTTKHIPFASRYYKRKTLAAALFHAGFVNVCLYDGEMSPEGIAAFPAGYWDLFQQHPMFCVITADKPQ